MNQILWQKFSRCEIPDLFSNAGVQRETLAGIVNIRAKWHRNTENRIDGVFFRIITDNGRLLAWIPPEICPNQHNYIWIQDNSTILGENFHTKSKPHLFVSNALQGKQVDVFAPQLQIDNLEQPEVIADFFKQDPDMLPKSIRALVFPKR